jgi:membrane-associated phospholipid phosphatase
MVVRWLSLRSSRRKVLFSAWLFIGLLCIATDNQIQRWLAHISGSAVRNAAALWQELGSTPGIILFLLSALVLCARSRLRTMAHFAICVSLAGILVQVLKHLVGRVRPAENHDTTFFMGPLGLINSGYSGRIDSMPSGHTAAAFAMATALAYKWPRQVWLWYLLALGVGLSRVLLDAHFLSDVILGALLGTLIGMLTNYLLSRQAAEQMNPNVVVEVRSIQPKKWIGQ